MVTSSYPYQLYFYPSLWLDLSNRGLRLPVRHLPFPVNAILWHELTGMLRNEKTYADS